MKGFYWWVFIAVVPTWGDRELIVQKRVER
jgi:hypothetical protein